MQLTKTTGNNGHHMNSRNGKMTKEVDGYRVRFERRLDSDISVVWAAITQPEQLAKWFTDIDLEFAPGGKITIRFRDDAKTESFGKIVRIEPPRLFEFTWEEELATWEIFQEGKGCRLVLTYSRLPKEYAAHVPAGWHIILDQLEEVLRGAPGHYPFGGDETELTRKMKAMYRDLLSREFPELTAV